MRECLVPFERFTHSRKARRFLAVAAGGKPCILFALKGSLPSLLGIFLLASGVEASWLDMFSRELKEARVELGKAEKALAELGQPMIGNTVPEFGIQHRMMEEPPPESPFVQVDLGESRRFDTVALIPALVDFQSVTQSPYAFPVRFRLDASDDAAFGRFTPLIVHTEVDHVQTSVAPVVVHVTPTKARYLRLTVTKLAQVEGRWTFALAEMVVLEGNRNIALGAKVQHNGGTGLPPRWMLANLTDGRTPLGPPIDRSSVPEFDALFANMRPEMPEPWMSVDLGQIRPLDEVRVHPLHARQGADVPGFAFPSRFKVQAATEADFSDAVTLFENADLDFPNPGNNAVVIAAKAVPARHVRFTMLAPQNSGRDAFALSELEVYAGGKNVSRTADVQSSGDARRDMPRPLSLLTDGHTSYGRLLELPEWLAQWEKRRTLSEKAASLATQITFHTEKAQQRALITGGLALLAVMALLGGFVWRSQRRQRREQQEFRNQLARDMHDEIGSNLAGIAVISETSALQADATSADWQEINRIAHETSDAMREVLWLVGARQESGIDLMEHLQRAAKRLLPNHEVCWRATAPDLPIEWPMEARRQVFLFFKEAVTNILKHAKASKVEFSAQVASNTFTLTIRDNGRGFDPKSNKGGIGLQSLRERAKTLNGACEINSNNQGTLITLKVPLR